MFMLAGGRIWGGGVVVEVGVGVGVFAGFGLVVRRLPGGNVRVKLGGYNCLLGGCV